VNVIKLRYKEKKMATVLKQPGTRYWIAAFRDASGKQHRRSTRETNRRRALEVARQFEKASKGKGNPHQVKATFADFYREHFGVELPFSTLRAYCHNWLATRKGETASATYARYEKTVNRFLEFLGSSQAEADLNTVTKSHITAFRDSMVARYTTRTANLYLKIVKMVFRCARLEGYLLQDPAESVKTLKNHAGASIRRPFTLDELRAILAVADSEWQSLIRCGLYTGQRLSDLAALTWNQIDVERDEIRLTVRKTGKSLLIPIASVLREHLLSVAGDDPRAPVHPRSYGIVNSQKGRVGTLSNQFAEILITAGLRPPRIPGSKPPGSSRRTPEALSFHSLRHTSVSLLKDAGIPDAVVMALVGHESAAMSHRYTHVGKEALQRATGSLPEI
jgi:integrase